MNGTIHFLNTGHSDCIILESEGHFAMVDAAEDSDYPPDKPNLNLPGYEDVVVDYLLRHCRQPDGTVQLDFILGTHAHSDHIGGFDTVIDHPKLHIGTAYLKPYHEEGIFVMERKRWDNVEVYTQMRQALERRHVPVVESFDGLQLMLGKLSIRFLNGTYRKRRRQFGENINSVVTLVEAGGTRAVLAGDLNYKDGDERRLAKQIGKVDLLKVGHHGYIGSTSCKWVSALKPQYAVITNYDNRVFPDVRFKLKVLAQAKILTTTQTNGIRAQLGTQGKITLQTGIMP